MRRLDLTQVAQADLKSIKRYSSRVWGAEQTERYIADLRGTMRAIVAGAVVSRERADLRPGLRMAVSGRHCIFFEERVACPGRSCSARSDGLSTPSCSRRQRSVSGRVFYTWGASERTNRTATRTRTAAPSASPACIRSATRCISSRSRCRQTYWPVRVRPSSAATRRNRRPLSRTGDAGCPQAASPGTDSRRGSGRRPAPRTTVILATPASVDRVPCRRKVALAFQQATTTLSADRSPVRRDTATTWRW